MEISDQLVLMISGGDWVYRVQGKLGNACNISCNQKCEHLKSKEIYKKAKKNIPCIHEIVDA